MDFLDTSHPLTRIFNQLNASQDIAIGIGGEEFSYRQLRSKVIGAQAIFKNRSEKGILILANDNIDTYAAILACWSLGKFYVPIHPNYPQERREKIAQILQLDFIFDSTIDSLRDRKIDDALTFPNGLPNPEALAYVLFTSGSTGEPKGVPIQWSNLCAFERGFQNLGYYLSSQDRFLQMFDLTFDLSVMSFLIPLTLGASFYTVPHDSMKYAVIAELLEEKRLTFALMVPSILTYLKPYFDEIEATHLRYSLFCGEALHEDIVALWSDVIPQAQIDNVYGPTENTIFCTRYTYRRKETNASHQGILSIGQSMDFAQVKLWNDEKSDVMAGEAGNLWLGGQYLTQGYVNREDLNLTQFVIQDNVRWYNSGDRAMYTNQGDLLYMGRQDNQLKVQGFRIEASEVEFHLKNILPQGIRVVVLASNNRNGIVELVAVSEGYIWNDKAVKGELGKHLPGYMIPSHFLDMKEFPLNVNGKVDRKKIMTWVGEKI